MENHNLVSKLARFALERRITMAMLLTTVVAVGLISAARLPLELKPRGLEGHFMMVRVSSRSGVPPENMDKLGIPLEEEVSTIRGLDSIETEAYKSGAAVKLRFKEDTDMDVAYRELRDRVERARARFPEGIEKPFIYKHEPSSDPVVGFRISYPPDSDYYDLINKFVIMPIQRIMGVADVEFRIYQREVRIEVDKDRAEAYGLTVNQIANRLRSDNFTISSGSVIDGGRKFALKSTSEFETMAEYANVPIAPNVFLRDVATITYEPEEAERLYRYNGAPANGIQVKKESEANTVAVSREIVETIEQLQKDPKLSGFDLSVYDNQGEDVLKKLNSLISSGQTGVLLAALVLFFFLRQIRMTAVIATAVPLCLLVALCALYFAGNTLNGLTIMGLVICIGLLVDNSVVVSENIFRHYQSGATKKEACLKGVSEIGFAITIATLTTLIVFCSGMLTDDGRMRHIISHVSLPVITSIIASLLAALMFIPLAVFITLPNKQTFHPATTRFSLGWIEKGLAKIYLWSFGRFNRGYNRSLEFFLKRRLDLSVILIVLLSGTFLLSKQLNTERPKEESIRYFSIHVRFPDQYTMDQRLAYVERVEAHVDANMDTYGLKAHEFFYGRWESRFAGFFAADRKHELTAREAMDLLYENMPEEPGVTVHMQGRRDEAKEGGNRNSNMHYIRLVGDDPELLKKIATDLKPTFELVPGVVDFLEDGAGNNDGPNEMALYVDRAKANALGVDPRTLTGTVSAAVAGATLPRFKGENGRQIPVRMLLEEEDRSDFSDLANYQIPTADGRVSTVGAITRMRLMPNNNDDYIQREDKKVSQWFGMLLEPGPNVWQTKRLIEEAKAGINLPDGVSFEEVENDFGRDEHKNGAVMLFLSIAFVYMLMAFFFESLLIPLSIVLTIPLAAVGAVIALKVTDTFVDQMVYTGGMILVGIVVNNGIVLVDYANRLRREGMERTQALLLASERRFRPIAMTALTTICSLLPLTVGGGEGLTMEIGRRSVIDFKSFGFVLIGGMTSATVLTLIVVPVFYTLIEDAETNMKNIWASVFSKRSDAAPSNAAPQVNG